ncbi:MAG: hypothetical protein AAGA64_02385 [Bacteroidota bacterium]
MKKLINKSFLIVMTLAALGLASCGDDDDDSGITETPDGGMVSLADGSTTASGVTGTDQLIFTGVTTTSTALNFSYWYVVTDADDNILDWVNPEDRNNATLDISGAPAGECRIWGWSYRGLEDPVVGENISTLNDNELEEISENFITVNRDTPDGGMVSLEDGTTSATGATGTDQLIFTGVTTTSTAVNLSYWYIVTDADDNILDWVNPEDRNNATVDISGAPAGECRIWGWSYKGLADPVAGENISTLNDDEEEEISDNFITVNRVTPDGGMVSLADGATTATGVTGTGQLTFTGVTTTSTALNLSYWYVVTDANDNILDWVNPEDRNNATVDISGAPDGVCHIWGWSYKGLADPVVGENISTLNDDDEEEISENWITVNRETPDGGMVALMDGSTTAVGEVGTDQLTFNGVNTTSTADNLSYWYIITDADDVILGWANPEDRDNATVDLSGAAEGVCHIWGWSYRGLADPVVGENISTLNDDEEEEISENWITVYRVVSSVISGGPFNFIVDGTADNLAAGDITIESSGTDLGESGWVVTDDVGNILGLPPTFTAPDFDEAGPGACLVWYISYKSGLSGLEVGMNASDLDGVFALSNPITVYRLDAPTLMGGPFTFTVGDGNADNIQAGAITMDGGFSVAGQSGWVVTDDANNILGLPGSFTDVDFDGAGVGVCLVWYITYAEGLTGLEVGNNVSDLSGAVYELSNSIEVNRE